MKEVGLYFSTTWTGDLEGFCQLIFSKVMGWEEDEISTYIAHLKSELRDLSIHGTIGFHTTYAQKPLDAWDAAGSVYARTFFFVNSMTCDGEGNVELRHITVTWLRIHLYIEKKLSQPCLPLHYTTYGLSATGITPILIFPGNQAVTGLTSVRETVWTLSSSLQAEHGLSSSSFLEMVMVRPSPWQMISCCRK